MRGYYTCSIIHGGGVYYTCSIIHPPMYYTTSIIHPPHVLYYKYNTPPHVLYYKYNNRASIYRSQLTLFSFFMMNYNLLQNLQFTRVPIREKVRLLLKKLIYYKSCLDEWL